MGLCGSSAVDTSTDSPNWTIQKRRTQDHYVCTKTLGEGASCKVVIAKDIRTKKQHALKILDKEGEMGDSKDLFDMEVKILRKLKHPNILEFVDAYIDSKSYCIVTGLCGGGELFDRVSEGKFSERTASRLTRNMLMAIAHCHACGIVHRDLKPENFVFESKSEDSDMKLIDFGCALPARDDEVITDVAGSPYYVAPEVLDPNRVRTGAMWKASDMWSIGVIIFLLVHGYPPFNGNDQKQIFSRIKKGKVRISKKLRLSPEVKDLIIKLLVLDPTQRLTADEALAHPWVATDVAPTTQLPTEVVQGIRDFGKAIKIKKAVVKMMAGGSVAAEKDRKVIAELFAKYDADGNGKLDANEVKNLLADIGMQAQKVGQFIDQFDDDGDGHIDLEEFEALKATVDYEKKGGASKKDLKKAFKELDKDGSGALDAAEVGKLLGVDDNQAAELIGTVDTDGNGEVDFAEFCQLMSTQVKKGAH